MNDEEFYKIINQELFDRAMKGLVTKMMDGFVTTLTFCRTPEYMNGQIKCERDDIMNYALENKLIPKLRQFNDIANKSANEVKELLDSGETDLDKIMDAIKRGARQMRDGSVNIPID